jgi:hypothetical protein
MPHPAPEGQREILVEMIYGIVSSLLPQDNQTVPLETERLIDEMYCALSYALGLPLGDH